MPVRGSMRISEGMADQHAERASVLVVPIAGVHLVTERMTPADVLVLAIDLTCALEEGVASQTRRVLAQREQLPDECGEPHASLGEIPVDPADLIVLAVSVVVALLRAAEFVTRLQHRYTLRDDQRREQVADLALAQLHHGGIFGRTFDAAIPAEIVVVAIAIFFAIRIVVLVVVSGRIVQREAVVTGHIVDARGRPPAARAKQVAGTGEALGEVAENAGVAAPETAHGVAIQV